MCRRRDAPLDAKSSRASLSHTSRRKITRRPEDWLAPFRREKKWEYLSGKGNSLPILLAVRVRRFITATGCRATLSPRGEHSEGSAKRKSVGQEIKYYPGEALLCAKPGFSLRWSKFWSFWLNTPRFNHLFPLKFLLGRKRLVTKLT